METNFNTGYNSNRANILNVYPTLIFQTTQSDFRPRHQDYGTKMPQLYIYRLVTKELENMTFDNNHLTPNLTRPDLGSIK